MPRPRLVEACARSLLDGTTHAVFVSASARELLEQYLGLAGDRLPAAITAWLESGPTGPLAVRRGETTLVVRSLGTALVLEERGVDARLTSREREVVELVGEGLTNAQIAERLWISPGTVRRHLENAFAKLGVSTRTAAARALSGS